MRKIGPGVDLAVMLHHAGGGLFVQRVADGEETGVRVMCTNGEPPLPTGANLRFDATITDEQWDSLDRACRGLSHEPAAPPAEKAEKKAAKK